MSPFEIRLRALFVKWGGYGRTHQIADHFDMSTPDVRRAMKRLQAKGVVQPSKFSAVNDTSWEFCDGTGKTA